MTTTATLNVVICYARRDQGLRDRLEEHLSSFIRSGKINIWYDRQILPGSKWEEEINTHLGDAHLILLLISPSFLASNYCWSKEMAYALEKHKAGKAHVIPVLLRPVFWKETPIGSLQVLPTGAKPITEWTNRNAAFYDVSNGISRVITALLTKLNQEQYERRIVIQNDNQDTITYGIGMTKQRNGSADDISFYQMETMRTRFVDDILTQMSEFERGLAKHLNDLNLTDLDQRAKELNNLNSDSQLDKNQEDKQT